MTSNGSDWCGVDERWVHSETTIEHAEPFGFTRRDHRATRMEAASTGIAREQGAPAPWMVAAVFTSPQRTRK